MSFRNILDARFFRSREFLLLVIPLLIYIIAVIPLSHWIVDDAGVTFAYARSLGDGHGLVSQPGADPVEGYSNTLWLLLMVPFTATGLFEPHLTPKLIALVFAGLTFFFLYRSLIRITGGNRPASIYPTILLAVSAPFVIWTTSGLENALYVFLIVISFYLIIRFMDEEQGDVSTAVILGVIGTAIALTRPEGMLFWLLFPMALVVKLIVRRNPRWLAWLRLLAGYTVGLGVTYGGFLLFRYLYFGYWLPNTYYAKGGPSSKILVPALTLQYPFLQKFQQLMASMFGTKLWLAMPLAIVVVLTLALAKRSEWRKYVMLIGFGFIGYYSYMIMPDDWMPEYRFAIPVFVFVSALIAVLGAFIVQSIRTPSAGIRKEAGVLLAALFLGLTLKVQVPRLQKFYPAPIVSFDHIANEFAFRFNRYAEELGLDSASVLLPDVGATLYYSNLRVYDLARLTDVTIARTLRKNQPAFYNYVFETIKPTFIHIHGNWTYAADFDADSRFRRDYIPINEYKDAWALRVVKREMMSGNYVRRDAVVGKEDILAALTAAK